MAELPGSIGKEINDSIETILKDNSAGKLSSTSARSVLETLFSAVDKEVEGLLGSGKNIEVATIYRLLSISLSAAADRIMNKDVKLLLQDYAESWESSIDLTLKGGVTYLEGQAINAEKEGRHDESSKMRSSASALDFSLQERAYGKKLDENISIKLDESIPKMGPILSDSLRGWIGEKIRANEQERSYPEKRERKFKYKLKPSIIEHLDEITVRNTSEPLTNKKGWYKWSVFLIGESETINQIRKVKYTLHPTFPSPEQWVTDGPGNGFKLDSIGWGEFEIKIDMYFDDDTIVTKYHWLDLGANQGSWQGGRK